MQHKPLIEERSASFATSYPRRLELFSYGIEVTQVRDLARRDFQRALYEQVTQVALRRGFTLSDLVIETKGGEIISVFSLAHRAAEEARRLIEKHVSAENEFP